MSSLYKAVTDVIGLFVVKFALSVWHYISLISNRNLTWQGNDNDRVLDNLDRRDKFDCHACGLVICQKT